MSEKNPKDSKMAVLSLPADYGYVVLTGETNPFHLAPIPQV
jgi:hypothetical protein